MVKQLNVRSDKAYEIASRLSRQTGRSRADVVLAALLRYAETKIGEKLTPQERDFVDELMALARRSAAEAPAGMTSDHSYLYDEKGLHVDRDRYVRNRGDCLAEPEARVFGELIASEHCLIGWPTVFESHQVLADVPRRRGLDVLDKVLNAPRVDLVAFDRRLFENARNAFDLFGRGRHKAKLNFGDCMAYAVAKVHDVPLLYKGDDFARTDIAAALP